MARAARTMAMLGVSGMLFACQAEQPGAPALSTQSDAVVVNNGRELNGRELNGRELNGRELNGRELNGRELNGISLNTASRNGEDLGKLWLSGSELFARGDDGKVLHGADLVGTYLASSGPGRRLALRIDGVQASPTQPDVVFYDVSVEGNDETWEPLCGTNAAGERDLAIALAGRWNLSRGPSGGSHIDDPGAFTFACRNFALAKCVEFGYRPWATVTRCSSKGDCGPYSLAAYHQACTRMLRADYCGDGRSFTVDGTPINVYDSVGIQADTESWDFEAEWTPDGARCVSRMRIPKNGNPPDCVARLMTSGCGETSDFDTGTLLMDEDVP